jgi:tryptophanase
VDEDYLNYRLTSTRYVGTHLRDAGVPLIWPTGGHAIYLDAKRFAPHIDPVQLPGVSVAIELYKLGGVRACEIGTLMFGTHDAETGEETAGPRELVRLAIPRRVYTQSHMDYVIEVVVKAFENRESLSGYRIVEQPPFLRHFSAKLAPVD